MTRTASTDTWSIQAARVTTQSILFVLYVGLSTIISGLFTIEAKAKPSQIGSQNKIYFRDEIQRKEYYGGLCDPRVLRTGPRANYGQQKCADFDFDVINWELPERTFFGYQDPDQRELRNVELQNPLDLPRFRDFKIAVVVNKESNSLYGPGQRVLVFARAGALPDIRESGLLFYFKTSTGRPGFETPSGDYNIQSFSPVHMSSKYELVDMYWAVFFNNGIAFHSFSEFENPRALARLGLQKASHGCVRLETKRAQRLYHLIGHVGTDLVPKFSGGRATGRYGRAYSTVVIVR